jgi:hypothetical protein
VLEMVMRSWMGILAIGVSLMGCTPSKSSAPKRAWIEELGGSTVNIIPAEGQPPYCLVFTVSAKGVVRQLTMNRENTSVPCEAKKPIGGVSYRIPVAEGKIRAHILFSDRKLEAGPMATQIHELAGENPQFTALDLRAPGQVMIETLEFTPMLEGAEVTVRPEGAPSGSASAPHAP